MAVANDKDYHLWFKDQVFLLTGGTGCLGTCLLYKLVVKLRVPRVYILARGSTKAIAKWQENLQGKADELLMSESICILEGDISSPKLGLNEEKLERLRQEVTVVVHAAANISLNTTLEESMNEICLPTLDLAELTKSFTRMSKFVFISTAYANTFLSDGIVHEKIYNYEANDVDPDAELSSVLKKEYQPNTSKHAWPYGYAKHLAEKLLNHRYKDLPLLIIRPTIIGPAIRQPFPHYRSKGSNPIETFFGQLIRTRTSNVLIRQASERSNGTNILDEVPVDLVANVCLLHTAAGSEGIVHAGSELYIPRTLSDFVGLTVRHAPVELAHLAPQISFTQDQKAKQSRLADYIGILLRDWRFNCSRSEMFKGLNSEPLGLGLECYDDNRFMKQRVAKLFSEIFPKPSMERTKFVEQSLQCPA